MRWVYSLEFVAMVAAVGGSFAIGRALAGRSRRLAMVLLLPSAVPLALQELSGLFPRLFDLGLIHPIAAPAVQATGFAAIGIVHGLIGTNRRRRLLIAAIFGVLAFDLVVPSLAMAIAGPEYAAGEARSGEGHVLQSTPHTCVAACLASILARWEIDLTESQVAHYCRTGPLGTDTYSTVGGVARIGRDHGVDLTCEVLVELSVEDLGAIEAPAILSVEVEWIAHAIALLEKDEAGRLVLGDPLVRPLQRLTLEEFASEYVFLGEALLVRRR